MKHHMVSGLCSFGQNHSLPGSGYAVVVRFRMMCDPYSACVCVRWMSTSTFSVNQMKSLAMQLKIILGKQFEQATGTMRSPTAACGVKCSCNGTNNATDATSAPQWKLTKCNPERDLSLRGQWQKHWVGGSWRQLKTARHNLWQVP